MSSLIGPAPGRGPAGRGVFPVSPGGRPPSERTGRTVESPLTGPPVGPSGRPGPGPSGPWATARETSKEPVVPLRPGVPVGPVSPVAPEP
ncbi:hypothetical protein CLM84_25780 [Streptomyces albidoflavus]|nr:hypothetical protein CLM84_25780 [Streptomyces albidoflavus]